jgi:hypothetical protein
MQQAVHYILCAMIECRENYNLFFSHYQSAVFKKRNIMSFLDSKLLIGFLFHLK